jgi:hypothetical protein
VQIQKIKKLGSHQLQERSFQYDTPKTALSFKVVMSGSWFGFESYLNKRDIFRQGCGNLKNLRLQVWTAMCPPWLTAVAKSPGYC